MNWRLSESLIRPLPVDMTSAPGLVLIHTDIEEIEKTGSDGNKLTYYQYQEAVTSPEEYQEYAIQKQQEAAEASDSDTASIMLNQAQIMQAQEDQDETLSTILLNTAKETA